MFSLFCVISLRQLVRAETVPNVSRVTEPAAASRAGLGHDVKGHAERRTTSRTARTASGDVAADRTLRAIR